MSDNPIKIIWKYKNTNRRVQYNTYIFVGNMIPKDIMTILNNIKDLSLYDTLVSLKKNEYKKLENFYGEKWYEKFFNVYHINSSINIIRESSSQKKEIEEIYGEDWYKKHISSKKLIEKEIIYSYEAMVKYENQHKKIKERGFVQDEEIDVDYRTIKASFGENLKNKKNNDNKSESESESDNIQEGGNNSLLEIDHQEDFKVEIVNKYAKNNNLKGGEYEDEENDNTEEEDEYNDLDDGENTELDYSDENEISEEEFKESDDEGEEELNYEDEEEYNYQEDDVTEDSKLSDTTKLIKKALENEKIFEKNIEKMTEFDITQNNSVYDTNLKDVYKKFYITTNYIYKDDTIKTIRNKICCSLKCNPVFGDDLYLAPSRQYFWIEYFYEDKINKISVGQKWMKKNELLNIDIEPNNNIKVYEELRDQLKVLRNNMRRYNNKIRMEDDSNNILYDYDTYFTNNEIYMIDLYNELGVDYSPSTENLRNLQDIYIKIFFQRVKSEDIRYILELLNKQNKIEIQKNQIIFENLNNDLILENEIVSTVENIRKNEKYTYLFKDNYITQSVIHVNLKYNLEGGKVNLYKIFNEFMVNEKYPFIQYQTNDGNKYCKFSEKQIMEYYGKKKNNEILEKWFKTTPYGISIKYKTTNKNGDIYVSITLHENGRVEYKSQWKEEDMAKIDDIKDTYVYVYELIKKINNENSGVKFEKPHDVEFKYAFINTIQKFILPEKYTINHNDLSNFSRYFFPYVSLVIFPKKRQSKIQKEETKGKYGTYLRYKKVSKYENQARIEQRIVYFMKNYEFTEKTLIDELSKQFNITEDKALEEYEKVKAKYINIKKARKVLKKMETVPKSKSPGTGIDIQGKDPDKYKIRISGAKDKVQLYRIIDFMNILIYAYSETYLKKTPKYQELKHKLELLKNIAKRRNKVDEFAHYSKDESEIKKMASVDKQRLGYKPEKGENQYSRLCQNSGKTKKRRPKQYTTTDLGEMIKKGYHFNKKTGYYERQVSVKERGKKKNVLLQAVNLAEYDDEGSLTGNEIFYTCNPEDNGDFYYIGFLTKAKNPNGQCLPCCFLKSQLNTTNKEKNEFNDGCLKQKETQKDKDKKDIGDKLYVLQDTNKLSKSRVGYLGKFMDIYFNFLLKKTPYLKLNHNYLALARDGYFFKYGVSQDENPFLNSVSVILGISTEKLLENIYGFLKKDKNMQYFTSLNNGDIRTRFENIENFINYLKNCDDIDFGLVGELLSIPNVCCKHGLNIVVFTKRVIIINESFEKEKIREDYFIDCQNSENINSLIDKDKECCFIIREEKSYYPIVLVQKKNEDEKEIQIFKKFKYENKTDNIVNHVNKFYEKTCLEQLLEKRNIGISAKVTAQILYEIKDEKYHPKFQYVDTKNKCKYIITKNNILVPVNPSGSVYTIQIVKNYQKYIKKYDETLSELKKIHDLSGKRLPLLQIGVYYDKSSCINCEKEKIVINGIMTETKYLIPVEKIEMMKKILNEKKLLIEPNPQIEDIDESIETNEIKVDSRIKNVNLWKYNSESYELFRFEFSNFINQDENKNIKNKMLNVINDEDLNKEDKMIRLKLILYKISDSDLYDKYKQIVKLGEDTSMMGGKLLLSVDKLPNLDNYKLSNDRVLCEKYKDKDMCNTNPHCKFYHNSCSFIQTNDNIIKIISKIAEEMINNMTRRYELFRINGYYVSDIGDIDRFTEREGQKIVKTTSTNINKVLSELFGKDNFKFKTGKKKDKIIETNYQSLNQENQMIDMKIFLLQKIINDNMNLFRAYANNFYWIKNKYSDIQIRNLGFYNPMQSELAINFKSYVISWLINPINIEKIPKEILNKLNIKKSVQEFIELFVIDLINKPEINTNCLLELFVLYKINGVPIIVYDEYQTIIFVIDKKNIFNENLTKEENKELNKYNNNQDCINLRFTYTNKNDETPSHIDSIFFK